MVYSALALIEVLLFEPLLVLDMILLVAKPLLVVSVPRVEHLFAKVASHYFSHQGGVVGTAVRADGVVLVGIHHLPAVALDERVGRGPYVVLAVRRILYLVVSLLTLTVLTPATSLLTSVGLLCILPQPSSGRGITPRFGPS